MKKSLKANKWLWIISVLLVIVIVGFLINPRDGHDFEVDEVIKGGDKYSFNQCTVGA